MKNAEFRAVILAAGKGTRMKSDLPKVLHEIEGKPLLSYVLDAAKGADAKKIIVIIGHQAQRVRERFDDCECVFVKQEPQLGTGHAVLQAKKELNDYNGLTLILCGDVPLLKAKTINNLIKEHVKTDSFLTVLTTIVPDAHGYGRIVKDKKGDIEKIVEQLDATDDEKKISEINTGIYCVNTPFLLSALEKIENKNNKQEYYLTDIVEIARRECRKAHACVTNDYIEVMGINTPDELIRAGKYLK
ncbi:MAG: NTP transferase domain-containing protein [Syntrophaceae bacterium]|nr:NTP transferase domain-containing protein [Syntrophaceae bacterium]